MIVEQSSEHGGEGDQASSSLIAHIQSATELQKALLARELHDELGGLLVGAVMDLAWAEQHLSAPPAELKQKLVRARQTLATAIDLKRRLIEELRPTLLDNVGLFAALRWHVQAICARGGLECTIHMPEEEQRFLPNIPIALFRIVQEAFALIAAYRPSAAADFSVTVDSSGLVIHIATHPAAQAPGAASGEEVHALAAIEHRTVTLGGEFKYAALPGGATSITAQFPLTSTILPA